MGNPSDRLAIVPTGPKLCARVADADLAAASDEQLLELLNAATRQLSYQQAQVWQIMAELTGRDPSPNLAPGTAWTPGQIFDSAVEEVRAELRLTRRAAQREVTNAAVVVAEPRIAQALKSGAIDRGRAIVLADGCLDLTDEQSTKLLNEVLPGAAKVTTTRLAEKVQKIAIALDPRWAERRYRQAVRERRVVGYLNQDGSATVSGQNLPAAEAAAAYARVAALAAAAKRAGAHAHIDLLRAELFLGLLDGRLHGLAEAAIIDQLLLTFPKPNVVEPTAPPELAATPMSATAAKARPIEPAAATARGVELQVGLGTLLGIDERPAEIAGWGPVTASVARELAVRQRNSEWRFAVVDADGQALFDGVTRRRPRSEPSGMRVSGGIVELHVPLALLTDENAASNHPDWATLLTDLAAQYAAQRPIEQDPAARFAGRPLRRRTQIKFRRCIFPGCRRPASECDLDHRHDWARGGETEDRNLAPPCRHDHSLKTLGGWRLIRRDDITFVWISPLGRRHIVQTEPVAPPLPSPIPRPLPPEAPLAETDPDPPPPAFAAYLINSSPAPEATLAVLDPPPY